MFFAACEGYFDKLEDASAMFRNLAGIVNRSMGGTANMMDVWPLHGEKKAKVLSTWTDADLTEMKNKANDIFAKHVNKKKS